VPFNFTSDPYIVMRSRKLLGLEDISYAQYMEMPGFFQTLMLFVTMVFFFILLQIPPAINWLRSFKAEGSGPSQEIRKNSKTCIRFYSVNKNGEKVSTTYKGLEAYTVTALFASEAALLILKERDELPTKGGVCTPASALGERYLQRLLKTGQVHFLG